MNVYVMEFLVDIMRISFRLTTLLSTLETSEVLLSTLETSEVLLSTLETSEALLSTRETSEDVEG
jgi:hypothetical protein